MKIAKEVFMAQEKIEKADVGWSESVVMICTKCGKQFDKDRHKESPDRIKSELKLKSRSELGPSVRVITTSCLNICPVDKIAIVKASNGDAGVFTAITVGPDESVDNIFNELFESK